MNKLSNKGNGVEQNVIHLSDSDKGIFGLPEDLENIRRSCLIKRRFKACGNAEIALLNLEYDAN